MIFSTTFRHTHRMPGLRARIEAECLELGVRYPQLTRVEAVVSREGHHQRENERIRCHLHAHMAHAPCIEVTCNDSHPGEAFSRCLQCLERRINECRNGQRHHHPVHDVTEFDLHNDFELEQEVVQ